MPSEAWQIIHEISLSFVHDRLMPDTRLDADQSSMVGGLYFLNNENDKLSVNTHISNEKLIKGMRLEQKRVHMRKELIKHIGQNTFEVSYTGRVPFSGLDKYISNFVPFLDMSLSGDLSAEIFAFKDVFSINIMQRSDDDKYFKRFVEILTEYHIECEFDAPSYFEIPDFELPR